MQLVAPPIVFQLDRLEANLDSFVIIGKRHNFGNFAVRPASRTKGGHDEDSNQRFQDRQVVRATIVFNKLLRLVGVWVTVVEFVNADQAVLVDVRLRRRRLVCPHCGWHTPLGTTGNPSRRRGGRWTSGPGR